MCTLRFSEADVTAPLLSPLDLIPAEPDSEYGLVYSSGAECLLLKKLEVRGDAVGALARLEKLADGVRRAVSRELRGDIILGIPRSLQESRADTHGPLAAHIADLPPRLVAVEALVGGGSALLSRPLANGGGGGEGRKTCEGESDELYPVKC